MVAPPPLPPIHIPLLDPVIDTRILGELPPSTRDSCPFALFSFLISSSHDQVDTLRPILSRRRETRVRLRRSVRARLGLHARRACVQMYVGVEEGEGRVGEGIEGDDILVSVF